MTSYWGTIWGQGPGQNPGGPGKDLIWIPAPVAKNPLVTFSESQVKDLGQAGHPASQGMLALAGKSPGRAKQALPTDTRGRSCPRPGHSDPWGEFFTSREA